jgi:hypothetical protein
MDHLSGATEMLEKLSSGVVLDDESICTWLVSFDGVRWSIDSNESQDYFARGIRLTSDTRSTQFDLSSDFEGRGCDFCLIGWNCDSDS